MKLLFQRGAGLVQALSACTIMELSSIGATGCLLVKNNFPKYLLLLFFAIWQTERKDCERNNGTSRQACTRWNCPHLSNKI